MRYLVLFAAIPLAAQEFVSGQAARLVIGQPTFTAQKPGPTSETLLGGASGLAYGADTLFVADSSRVGAGPDNHRVMLYRGLSSIVPRPTDELQQGDRCPACVGPANVVLGQTDFTRNALGVSQRAMRLPTAVATDGTNVAVADTDNNRILIWRGIPRQNGQNADVVLGQANFTSVRTPGVDQKSLRGPQGVWIQSGKLFVADTMNHRVLIWNSIPTQNDAPADIVLGQSGFNVAPQPDLTKANLNAQANTLLNPVSVTSDGVRLFVSDLGHNRILIWNSIPTTNQAPANVVLGQPDFTSAFANNGPKVCPANGKNDKGEDTFPRRCAATISYPRFALSDGRRLFVADGGNDRVLIWNSIPTENAKPADVVLGQLNSDVNLTSDGAFPDKVSATDVMRTPMSLAFDGLNLYVSDTFNRRVLVFTPAANRVPYTGVRNAASRSVYALGSVTVGGTIRENDELTIKIAEKEYKYKVVKDDKFDKIIREFVTRINADGGDPNVIATPLISLNQVILTSRVAGEPGNEIALTTSASAEATTTVTASGATLAGGQDAARLAGGSIVTILGERLSPVTASVPEGTNPLPRELAGVQVYFDGVRAPVLFVSPTEVRAQIPWELADAQSASAVIRIREADGSITVTAPVAVPLIAQNPGIFALDGVDPRPGLVTHGSSFPQTTIVVEGTAKENDKITVVIRDREYAYTVVKDDSLELVRDRLIAAINGANDGAGDPEVVAVQAGVFRRILLRGRRPGPDLNGLPVSIKLSDGASAVIQTTNPNLCCANVEGAPVTEANPAIPGESIIVYATGLGAIKPASAQALVKTGEAYTGPADNEPVEFVSSLAGGKTANILFARLKPGLIGIYEVVLELNADMPTNPSTQLTIAQSFQVSNIVAFPVRNPND